MCLVWVRTVLCERNSSRAICGPVSSLSSSLNTSSSRSLNDSAAVSGTGGPGLGACAAVEALRATALHRADALRDAVTLTDWERIAPGLTVRLSIGVAATVLGPGAPGATDRLYREADRHLYAAKRMPEATAG